MAGKIYNPKYPGLYYFDTFTFTTLGTSGHRGPDSTKKYEAVPWSQDQFSIVNGQQQWTVPASGTYLIEAAGAYGAAPGRVVSGEVNLSEGQVVSLLVGQLPVPLIAAQVGGGGGTFVTYGGKPLIVASGGDGTGGHAASFIPSGSGTGGSGAGYYGDGSQTNSVLPFLVPSAYVNGGFGNSNVYTNSEGGFGGGQCPFANGGGGYTGSPGNGVSGATCYADSTVTNFTDLGASGNTAGYVTVSLIDPVPVNSFYAWDKVWTSDIWTDPFPSQWSSSAYGNGTFVVIADSALPIMYSTDGVNWSIYTTGVSYGVSIRCISYGSGIFVAAGTDFVLQSPDGINWTQGVSPFPDVRAITYAGDRFIAIDPDYAYYSFDGISWTPVSLPSTGFYDSLTYGNGLVVASGTYFSVPITIYSNNKGLIWNTGTITAPSNANSAYVAYGNGKFVIATNQSEVFYSTDAETWTTVNVPDIFSTIAIVFGNGLFVTANYQQDYVLSSSDGITWQKSQTGVIQNPWSTIVYGNSVFTIFSYYSSPVLLISQDALNWLNPVTIKSTNLIKTQWNFVQYGNGTYVTGSQQGYIQYSFDGTTWYRDVQGIPTPNTIDIYVDNIWWSSCMWSDILGKFIVTSTNDQSPVDAPVIIYSSDGRTWSSDGITGVTPARWYGSVWGNDKIVVVGASAPYVMYSKDGFTWSSDVTGVTPTGYDDVTYGDGKFVAVSYNDGITMSSTDGINWSQSSVGDSTVNLTSVTFGNGKFVTISPNGSTHKLFYSSDGINWSSNTTGVPLSSSYYYISFGAGLFMTTCLNATPVVIYSSDGINWFSDTTGGIPTFWISVTYGNGKFIAVTGDVNVTVSSMSTNLVLTF
jgi:hypothetical protein